MDFSLKVHQPYYFIQCFFFKNYPLNYFYKDFSHFHRWVFSKSLLNWYLLSVWSVFSDHCGLFLSTTERETNNVFQICILILSQHRFRQLLGPDNWCVPFGVCIWFSKRSLSVFATEASAGKKASKTGSSSIQRSVETGMAVEYPRGGSAMNRQASRESTDGSMNSYSSEGKYVSLEA